MRKTLPAQSALKRGFRRFFEFGAGTTSLIVSFIGVLLMTLLVFPALPLHGEMIDLKLYYSLADIQVAMQQYGPQGRATYALASATLDTLFPVLYVTFFAGLIYRFRPAERLWVMAFIPVVAGVWDLGENAQIIAMLLQYPDLSSGQVAVASFFTTVKHLLSAVYEVTALVFLTIFLVRRLK
ncbi:hypothetical protein [Rhodoferax sp. UBA5149]|uniref:hypothetical protein n=1 Tax=Rhodoferax sp. UBA5149 TaxID=1947379 RepID=UPI0025E5DB42|nr:hypothetical protein [Rhodoferax sp. UBA5149]